VGFVTQSLLHHLAGSSVEHRYALLATVQVNIPEGLCSLLRLCRKIVVGWQKTESALVRSLEQGALAYLMAVDRGQRNFQVVETSNSIAA
jgi:hypothetical protein